uniref:Uncharacterized protein n=1 Tax=Spodoptera frugiperda nuclear polyhedrosis virus TaxID=10455 RepID=A0A0R5RHL4_NPVSF|nr:hypothetical protein [Spodoptera frugiperda multiple nucleopolyhedrovirus]
MRFAVVSIFVAVILINSIKCNVQDYFESCSGKNNRTTTTSISIVNHHPCNGNEILAKFKTEKFNFTRVTGLRRFIDWITLIQDYLRHKIPSEPMIFTVVKHLKNFVIVNENISYDMQILGDRLYEIGTEIGYYYVETILRFKDSWATFQHFYNNFVIWSPTKLDAILKMYAAMRKYRKFSKYYKTEIDDATIRVINVALQYPLNKMSKQHVKQAAYVHYVSKLQDYERKKFDTLYETVEITEFPQTTTIYSGIVKITLHHNIQDLNVLNKMQEQSKIVYDNFKRFYNFLNVSFIHEMFNVDMYVYANRSEYNRMGLLITPSIKNGGITLFRNNKPTAAVYFVKEDIVPHAFNHELFHCLMYTTNRMVNMKNIKESRWFIEGTANRFGYEQCYWRNYFNMRNYQHKTIDDIVRSNYNDDMLYPMGSALVSFLFEKHPQLLRNAILTDNYSIPTNDALEHEFKIFKLNKYEECIYLDRKNQLRVKDMVQNNYLKMISNVAFEKCHNVITVRFDDCMFVLTPQRLYIENNIKNDSIVYPQRIIKLNRYEVTSLDLDFLQKGLIKFIVSLMLIDRSDPMRIVDKYFNIDNNYSYKSNVSCRNEEVMSQMLMNMPVRKETILALAATNYELKQTVQKYEKIALACQTFIPPAAVNVTGSLRSYVEHLPNLQEQHIAAIHLTKPVDALNNTIIHLAAMFNKNLFLRFYRLYNNHTRGLLNAFNETPIWLFDNTQKYIRQFRHEPYRYCLTKVMPRSSLNNATTYQQYIFTPATTTTTTTVPSSTTTTTTTTTPKIEEPELRHGNFTMIEKDGKSNVHVKFVKVSLISITVIVVLIFIGVSCNTVITITIIKHYNNKTNNLISSTLQFNKQKFYVNDECTLPLFD